MKKTNPRIIAATLSLAMAMSVLPTTVVASGTETFRDVPQSHWAYDAVEWMASQGIAINETEGAYDPSTTVTYAQWAKMVVDVVHPGQCFHCTQVLGDEWWGGYIGAALDVNLSINGRHLFADTMVHQMYVLTNDATWLAQTMDAGVSRYDMARVLYNMAIMMGLEDKGQDVSGQIGDWDTMASSHMAEAVHFCYANGLIQGDQEGNFNGSQTVTRAQAAAVLHRLLEAVETQASQEKKEETKTEEVKTEEKTEDSSSKDDSSSSDKDSSSSDKNSSSSEVDADLLNKVLKLLEAYFNAQSGDTDTDKNDNNDGDDGQVDGDDCTCEDNDCDLECGDDCQCEHGGEPDPDGGEPDPDGGEPAPDGGEPDPNGGEPDPNGGEPDPNGGEPDPNGGEPDPNGGEPDNTNQGDVD